MSSKTSFEEVEQLAFLSDFKVKNINFLRDRFFLSITGNQGMKLTKQTNERNVMPSCCNALSSLT
jgi:hypothetical protein